jgi:diguanylate cyclase (GGDEF)-like protein/PAS domain S-box-containing protein
MFQVFNCLATEHDWRLVIVAGVVCFLASLTAINLFDRARAASGRARVAWIITAGAATGCGIWATHFIAMLAYEPGVPVAYNIGLTALSLLAAIVVTSVGLAVAVSGPSWAQSVGGGIVGAGVACMHYLGMWALELPGHINWDAGLVFVSIAVGLILGSGALTIAVRHNGVRWTLASASLLCLAIVSHHFVAMGAVEIAADPTRTITSLSLSPYSLAVAIAAAAVSLLGMCLIGALSERRSEERLREQNIRLDAALNNMCQGLCMFDTAGRLLISNKRYLELYGLSPSVVKPGCSLIELLEHRKATGTFSGDAQEYAAGLLAGIAKGKTGSVTQELSDGRVIILINEPMADGGWVATHEDITERRMAEKDRDRTKNFLNTVIENVPATLVVKDARERRFVLVNKAGEEFFGVAREQMIGKTDYDFFDKNEADVITARDNEVLQSGNQLVVEDHPIRTPGRGHRLVTSKRLTILGDDHKPAYLLGVIEDITERKQAEAKIAHMAHHDSLTDLPNRIAFNECLLSTLDRATASKDTFAVMCLDLDRFKEVNDVFGHSTGDDLLREVARRLQAEAGGAFIGRLGGDEFIIIAADGPQPSTAERLSERLLGAVCGDIEIGDQVLRVGLTIGIALYPTDGSDPATLIGNADAALYRAKAEARGSIRFFEPEMDERLRDRRALQHDLRTAVERDDLQLDYQPQARLGGEVVGFEALVRWRHPTRGIVPPDTFIPIAEENGTIIAIGEWVLREACREAASWQRPLRIAVNLSPVQFQHGDLAGLVHSVLLETGLSPGRLELEITEGVLIGDFSRAISILRRLKTLGVRIAMDDFGTGYSSLSYLQSFPFDKIKIDQSFISNLGRNPQSQAIIRAVIGLGHGLNLPITAEGVETQDQLAFLSCETCDEVQGFLIGRPGPMHLFAHLVGHEQRPLLKAAAQ